MNRQLTSTVIVAVSVALSLTACASSASLTTSSPSSASTSSTQTTPRISLSDADIMFAQMMIPHHEQAVEMSTLAETRSTNASVLELARQIKDAQGPEIVQMTQWLTEAGAPLSMGMDMPMEGVLTEEQMTALSNASGTDFDKLYLTGMIAHHQGAVSMAKSVANSSNADVKALSAAIISSQTSEIEKMQALLAGL